MSKIKETTSSSESGSSINKTTAATTTTVTTTTTIEVMKPKPVNQDDESIIINDDDDDDSSNDKMVIVETPSPLPPVPPATPSSLPSLPPPAVPAPVPSVVESTKTEAASASVVVSSKRGRKSAAQANKEIMIENTLLDTSVEMSQQTVKSQQSDTFRSSSSIANLTTDETMVSESNEDNKTISKDLDESATSVVETPTEVASGTGGVGRRARVARGRPAVEASSRPSTGGSESATRSTRTRGAAIRTSESESTPNIVTETSNNYIL